MKNTPNGLPVRIGMRQMKALAEALAAAQEDCTERCWSAGTLLDDLRTVTSSIPSPVLKLGETVAVTLRTGSAERGDETGVDVTEAEATWVDDGWAICSIRRVRTVETVTYTVDIATCVDDLNAMFSGNGHYRWRIDR